MLAKSRLFLQQNDGLGHGVRKLRIVRAYTSGSELRLRASRSGVGGDERRELSTAKDMQFRPWA